jgi:outer membrane protein OmpA-like peptidoglycan-associated protein
MSTWTTKFRGPALSLTIAAAVAAALPAQAEEKRASRQENIGVVSGLAVGAVAGGPVGAIIGAATGAVLGDRYHRQAVKNQSLSTDLGKTEQEKKRLHSSLFDSEAQRQKMSQTLESARSLETDVKFRTASADLSPQELEKIHKLGSVAKSLSGTTVRISGYADPRGSKLFNENLSAQRAETVAMALIEAGVPSDRMVVEGLGEKASTTADGDMDGYAFDRRVTVKLEQEDSSKVASNQ